MSDATLEAVPVQPAKTKAELEGEKILLEIEQLKEPWWKKPAYLSALLPTLLAFGTLMTAFLTGYFKNEYQLIDMKNESAKREQQLLKLEKDALNTDKDKIQASIAGLEGRKQELEKERAANEAKFRTEQENLDRELGRLNTDRTVMVAEAQEKRQELNDKRAQLEQQYQTQRAAIDKQILALNNDLATLGDEKKRLEDEKVRLEGDKTRLEGEKARLEEENELAPILVHLANIRPESASHRLGDSPSKMVKIIQDARQDKRRQFAQAVEKALNDETSPVARGSLLFVLYKGTGEVKWKESLFSLTRNEGRSLPSQYWNIFDFNDWSMTEKTEALEMATEVLESSQFTTSEEARVFEGFRHFYRGDDTFKNFKNKNNYFNCVKRTRNLARNKSARWYDRLMGFEVLASLSPQAYYVAVAAEATDAEPDGNIMSNVVGEGRPSPGGSNVASLNIPKTVDKAAWGKWLADHRRLVELWTEPELTQLRNDHQLVDKYDN